MRISDWSSDVCSSDLVLRIGLQPHLVRYTCSHRHSRDSCGTDQRIDLVLTETVHHFGHENTRCGTTAKGNHTQHENPQGFHLQEGQIGRAHVLTPVTNAHIVCRLLLEKKKTTTITQRNI